MDYATGTATVRCQFLPLFHPNQNRKKFLYGCLYMRCMYRYFINVLLVLRSLHVQIPTSFKFSEFCPKKHNARTNQKARVPKHPYHKYPSLQLYPDPLLSGLSWYLLKAPSHCDFLLGFQVSDFFPGTHSSAC